MPSTDDIPLFEAFPSNSDTPDRPNDEVLSWVYDRGTTIKRRRTALWSGLTAACLALFVSGGAIAFNAARQPDIVELAGVLDAGTGAADAPVTPISTIVPEVAIVDPNTTPDIDQVRTALGANCRTLAQQAEQLSGKVPDVDAGAVAGDVPADWDAVDAANELSDLARTAALRVGAMHLPEEYSDAVKRIADGLEAIADVADDLAKWLATHQGDPHKIGFDAAVAMKSIEDGARSLGVPTCDGPAAAGAPDLSPSLSGADNTALDPADEVGAVNGGVR